MHNLQNPMLIPLEPHDPKSKWYLAFSIPGIRKTAPGI